MRHALLIVALVFCCLLPSGAAVQHNYTGYGPTRMSCGSYLAAAAPERDTLDWWVLGFVTGINFERRLSNERPDLASTDSRGIEAWVAKYCAEHPLDELVIASVALVKELTNRTEPKP